MPSLRPQHHRGLPRTSHTGLCPGGGEGQGLPPTPPRHTRTHASLVPAGSWLCWSRPHFPQAGRRMPGASARGGSGLLQACGHRGPCHRPRSPYTWLQPPPAALVPRPTGTGRLSNSPTGLWVASVRSPLSRGPSPTAWACRSPRLHHAALPQPPRLGQAPPAKQGCPGLAHLGQGAGGSPGTPTIVPRGLISPQGPAETLLLPVTPTLVRLASAPGRAFSPV